MLQGELEVKGSMTWKKQSVLAKTERAEDRGHQRESREKGKVDRRKRVMPVWDYGCGSRPASIGLNCSHREL